MSTPTPIETVRAHLAWMAECFATVGMSTNDDPLYAALASVLADAERFKALELAHLDPKCPQAWCERRYAGAMVYIDGPLSELADRLREGAT